MLKVVSHRVATKNNTNLTLPKGAEILSALMIDGWLRLSVLINPDKTNEVRIFRVFETREEIHFERSTLTHIADFIYPDHSVGHLFEISPFAM